MDEETSAEGKKRQRKALQSFAKEFGRGVREQRTRGKAKETAGTLPLALSMFRRNASAHGKVDLLKVRFKGVKDKLQFKTQPKNMRLSIQKAT